MPEEGNTATGFSKVRGSAMKLPMGQINIRVPMDVYNALQSTAQTNFRSLKSQCELILCQWVANNVVGFETMKGQLVIDTDESSSSD